MTKVKTLGQQMVDLQEKITTAETALDTASNVKKSQQARRNLYTLYRDEDELIAEIEEHGEDAWYCKECEHWFDMNEEDPVGEYCEECADALTESNYS